MSEETNNFADVSGFPKHKRHKIEIKPPRKGEVCWQNHLYIDGKEIHGIRSIQFVCKPCCVPSLLLDLTAFDLTIDSTCLLYDKDAGAINFVEAEDNEVDAQNYDELKSHNS